MRRQRNSEEASVIRLLDLLIRVRDLRINELDDQTILLRILTRAAGFLSQMTSLQFNELTAEEGEIVRLSPSLDPDKLGIVIPADFRREDLRLWRFTMSPNYG